MPSMPKKDFAKFVGWVKDALEQNVDHVGPEAEFIDDALERLCEDLGYVAELVKLVPEDKLKELESKGEETFW